MKVPPDATKSQQKGESKGRRKGRQHPGVQLRKPRGKVTAWVIRYRDPETGKVVDRALVGDSAKNETTRTAYCVQVSRGLRRRNEDIAGGAAPHKEAGLEIKEAITRYFAQATVRSRTRESYEEARDQFLGWCEDSSLRTVRHLNRGWLVVYRRYSIKREEDLSPFTINAGFRRIGVILNWLIDSQILRLTRDDVRVAFKKLPVDEVTKRDFLRVDQIRALLEAAKRHDAIRFKANRKGVAALRYEPIHDYILFLLLTGLRPGEALQLTWDRVDLRSHQLHVHPTQSKKRKDRIVDLSVCPSVVPMLESMKDGKRSFDRVWSRHTKGSVDSTLDRLRADPLCPPLDYQLCRVTAATFLACMPSYGPVQESKQLGHSITTAETYYVGRVRVSPDAKTLEAAYEL